MTVPCRANPSPSTHLVTRACVVFINDSSPWKWRIDILFVDTVLHYALSQRLLCVAHDTGGPPNGPLNDIIRFIVEQWLFGTWWFTLCVLWFILSAYLWFIRLQEHSLRQLTGRTHLNNAKFGKFRKLTASKRSIVFWHTAELLDYQSPWNSWITTFYHGLWNS